MKTFLSIGAGPGMGFATAERFAREGFRVVLAARSLEKTRELAQRLTSRGFQAEARTVDAADPSSIAALVSETERAFGTVDVLHYNAAAMRKANIGDQPAATFNQDLAINIGGAQAAVQAVVPGMTQRGGGDILLTGGGFALAPSPEYLSLSIGKAGIHALAQGLFDSLAERNIHVSTVTVAGFVSPSTQDVENVASLFWSFHKQERSAWTREETYTPNS